MKSNDQYKVPAGLFFPFEAETVGYDANAAHGHSCTGYHRVEQKSVDRVKDTGCHRYAYDVVDECPEEVLFNVGDGAFA